MGAPQILSAEKFISCLMKGDLPNVPYIVNDEVSLFGWNSEEEERLVISEAIDLGEGIFNDSVNIYDVVFKSSFDFGKSNFKGGTNINSIFDDVVNFCCATFDMSFSFSSSVFNEEVSLGDATFFGHLIFNNAVFKKNFDFFFF